MEENELEEGEACSGQEDDACIDPEIALSYIDEKLQDVLGHFQKDFEGGVSAENLGAKFGGYGSFLPCYQRSPSVLNQPKSPPRPTTHAILRSPCNLSVEGVKQNPSVATNVSITRNNTVSTAQVNNLGSIPTTQSNNLSKRENNTCSQDAGRFVPQHDASNKTVNNGDQKSLKVRLKVGPDNSFARNNAAIYSGLGLDSPSSSPEDSPDGSGGGSPDESPVTILQVMTCFSVPGGYLLSPLHDHLFHLSAKESSSVRKSFMLRKGVSEVSAAANSTLPMKESECYSDKKVKPDEKNGGLMEVEKLNCKNETSEMLEKEMDCEIPAGQNVLSNASSVLLLPSLTDPDAKVERQMVADPLKVTNRMTDLAKDPNKISVKDGMSLSDIPKDDRLASTESVKSCGLGSSENESAQSKGKLNSKISLVDKVRERRPITNCNDASSDMLREGKSRTQKSDDMLKLNYDGCKDKDNISGHAAVKQLPSKRTKSHENDWVLFQGYNRVHEGKDKLKGSHNKCVPSVDSTKENLRAPPSIIPKEKKKNSHSMGEHSRNKSKMVKSRKEMSRGYSRESHGEVVRNLNEERVDPRINLLEPFMFTEESKDRPGLKKYDNSGISEQLTNASAIPPSIGTVSTSDAAAALQAPVLIEDNWVQCDKCQKWRLLPYGTDPENLPKKWKCNMQIWLQGLNKCSISEEETTKAFNALYLVPASGTGANLNGHHDLAASSITSADPLHIAQRHEHPIQTVPTTGRKKYRVMDTPNQPNHSSSKKNLQVSLKSKRSNVVNEPPMEMNSLTKSGAGVTSRSAEVMMEKHSRKQKGKHKVPGCCSDGGDFMDKSGDHSKSKSKREIDQDGVRTSKKFKKEGAFLVEDRLSDLEMASKAAPTVDNGLSTLVIGNLLQNSSDHSSSKDCETRGNMSASIKSAIGPAHVLSNGEFKEHVSALPVEKSGTLDFAAKKRKLKEWQESKGHQDTLMSIQHTSENQIIAKDTFSESELRKQKKAKVSTTEGRAPTMSDTEGKVDKKCRSTKMLFSGSREYPPDRVDEEQRIATEKEEMGHYHETESSRRALDGVDSSKIYVQLPTAATSSSSKVSSSCKTKANFQEVKGSPVESVSSSPLRIPNTENLSTKKYSIVKDDIVDVGISYMGNPKRCSNGEVDGGTDQSRTQRKDIASCGQLRSLKGDRATESGGPGSLRDNHSYQHKETGQLSGDKATKALYLKKATQIDVSSSEFKDTNMVGDTGNALKQSNNHHFEGPEKENLHCRDKLHNQHHQNGPSQRKSSKSSSLSFRERSKNSSSEADITKLKFDDSIGGKKELYINNVSNWQSEVDFNCDENSTYQEDARDKDYNFENKDGAYMGKKGSGGKWPHANGRGNYSNKESEHNLDTRNKNFSSKAMAGGSSCRSNFQENLQLATSYPTEQSSHIPDHIDRSGMASGRGILQLVQSSKDKHEAQSWVAQRVPTPTKGSRSEAYPGDSVNKSRKPDSQNGMRAHSLRQATPNDHDSASPMRKDGHTAAHLLKEARDLKHTANRMKKEGLEHESINIYFESALKFLHYSSLLEPSSADIARQGESQLKHMLVTYSETAKLCRYCAFEYERVKDLAAAALAYKCVEVAYMKTAHYKHSGASKDRNELQTALQTALPGESPSSSASDVDNLNNHGALDKAASAKAVGSPQIAGNCVIAARNRPHFMGLLSFADDMISALDATKKSQSAIAAASVNLGKDGGDGLSSVRKVLDFNYPNVEGLLRLVRLSIELISH